MLSEDEAKEFLRAIDVNSLNGLRYRALIGMMFYALGRVEDVLEMDCDP